ncbi:response regulator (plasmid) [Sinorhizobium chiapasense]|uniref:response regulator n=1 Tax=Sinorhizobium chiapasense TaxID=501572 RepID=UPI002FE38D5A
MEPVTILLVEDEAFLLMDFEDGLTEAGFNVVAVTCGTKAIDRLKAADSPIAGAITDVRLAAYPSGWDVARVARELDPEMPVVYISGDSAPDWASKGVPKSIMLEKPFAMPQLILAISQLLNDRSAGTSEAGALE